MTYASVRLAERHEPSCPSYHIHVIVRTPAQIGSAFPRGCHGRGGAVSVPALDRRIVGGGQDLPARRLFGTSDAGSG
jgi:hypothetical protein